MRKFMSKGCLNSVSEVIIAPELSVLSSITFLSMTFPKIVQKEPAKTIPAIHRGIKRGDVCADLLLS